MKGVELPKRQTSLLPRHAINIDDLVERYRERRKGSFQFLPLSSPSRSFSLLRPPTNFFPLSICVYPLNLSHPQSLTCQQVTTVVLEFHWTLLTPLTGMNLYKV